VTAPRTSSHGRSARSAERGIAMVVALFVLALLTVVAATSSLIGTTDVRATRNYRGASQAHFVAESAIAEAVQRINAVGVVNYQNDVANHWSTLWGATTHQFPAASGYTYKVTTTPTPGNTANAASITATADGPEGADNTVVATVIRSNLPSGTPGAVYLADDAPTDARFYADTFLIDGNDTNPTGGAGPSQAVPGITTRNDVNTQEAINSLAATQRDNVRGEGYVSGSPITPSVLTSPAAPSVTQMNQMITDLLALPRPSDVLLGNILGTNTYGTAASPQITHMLGVAGLLTVSGTVNGAGIMIVEGDLTVLGNFNFQGLVIVRGQFLIDSLPILPGIIPNNGGVVSLGTATVYGSMWTEKMVFNASGLSQFHYSSQAMAYANAAGNGKALPAPVKITSLVDCALIPAGAAPCS
jgi:hypothetical protein